MKLVITYADVTLSRENVTELDLIVASNVNGWPWAQNTETALAGIGRPPERVNTLNIQGSLKNLKNL